MAVDLYTMISVMPNFLSIQMTFYYLLIVDLVSTQEFGCIYIIHKVQHPAAKGVLFSPLRLKLLFFPSFDITMMVT